MRSTLPAWKRTGLACTGAAAQAGLDAGGDGVTVANKASCIYATYLERGEKARLELFLQVAARSGAQQAADPKNPDVLHD